MKPVLILSLSLFPCMCVNLTSHSLAHRNDSLRRHHDYTTSQYNNKQEKRSECTERVGQDRAVYSWLIDVFACDLSSVSVLRSLRIHTANPMTRSNAILRMTNTQFSTARPLSSSSSSSLSLSSLRPRRALLYMPGSSPKMLLKAQSLQVDTVCMDLEDAVAGNAKEEARGNIVKALNEWKDAKAERLGTHTHQQTQTSNEGNTQSRHAISLRT